MNVHKFGNNKPKMVQPKTIFWRPVEVCHPAKKVNPVTWDVFTQQPIVLKAGETKTIVLGFGFMMSKGVVLISLSFNLKIRQLSITNEVVLEETPDVVTTITSNSGDLLKINENDFLCRLYYSILKKILVINKMELKEKIYPNLPEVRNIPNAPTLEPVITIGDNGQNFRLKKISEVQDYLENEIKERERLSKKYLKISKTVDNVESGLTVFALGAGAGGIALLSTVVAIPATITLEACALVVGLGALIGKFAVRRTRTKSEKHLQIKMLADSKLNTLNIHISKAISDNKIDHSEFTLIVDELEKYKQMKEDIRSKSKKNSKLEEQESLIEKGKQEAREEFRRLVERNNGNH